MGLKVFVQIGTVVKGHAVPLCQLPGVQCDAGEVPADSLERLFTKLGLVSENIRVELGVKEEVRGRSVKFGIRTLYLKTTYTATLTCMWCLPEEFVLRRNVPIHVENPRDIDIFKLVDDKIRLYAWLTPAEFDHFRGGSEEQNKALAA